MEELERRFHFRRRWLALKYNRESLTHLRFIIAGIAHPLRQAAGLPFYERTIQKEQPLQGYIRRVALLGRKGRRRKVESGFEIVRENAADASVHAAPDHLVAVFLRRPSYLTEIK